MPLGVFYKEITEVLGRPIFSHEFAFRDASGGVFGCSAYAQFTGGFEPDTSIKCIVVGMDDA
jgi:hypothetical protein